MDSLSLSELAARYSGSRRICRLQAANLVSRSRALENFAKSRSPADCLRESTLTTFLQSLHGRGLSPITIRQYRGDLLTLWNYASDLGLAPPPRRRQVYLPRLVMPVPDCFSLAEVQGILAACSRLSGQYDPQRSRSEYWAAAVYVGWETGLRRSDVWLVRKDQIRSSLLATVSHKTGRRTIHRLTPQAVAAVDRVGSLHWSMSPGMFAIHFREVLAIAGLDHGQYKWLRRSSGSYVAARHGEQAGASHLGHAGTAIFRRFYDARLVPDAAAIPAPPPLN